MFLRPFLFLAILSLLSCGSLSHKIGTTCYNASDSAFTYSGRTETVNDSTTALITSAAQVKFMAKGDSITFIVGAAGGAHNYVSVELNGNYVDRYKIMEDSLNRISIALPQDKNNEVGLYKATEASNGAVYFYGVEAEHIDTTSVKATATIEFIGDSITCGFGADTTDISCGKGEWYDQHNAYLAYGPMAARALEANYRLISVSGMGMYRNWNDTDMPVMGDVYATTHLDGNQKDLWGFSGQEPDLVSICLGTNDLSSGDGHKEREPFDANRYTSAYIDFVQRIFNRYPDTKLALLTSPMVSGENAVILLECLQKVKTAFNAEHTITIFEFAHMQPGGCGGHPSLKDQKVMAEELIPFYTKLLE